MNATRPLPWWTWVLPLPLFHLGTWASLSFHVLPGTSILYLPIPMGIALAMWWGPRVLVGLIANAVLSVTLWELPWGQGPILAAVESATVGLSFFLYRRSAGEDCSLSSLREVLMFLVLGLLLPVTGSEALRAAWLAGFGTLSPERLWEVALSGWLAVALGCLAITVPALVFVSPSLYRRGLAPEFAESGRSTRSPLRAVGSGRRPWVLCLIIVSIVLASWISPPRIVFLVLGMIVIATALVYGFAMSVLCVGAMAWVAVGLMPVLSGDFGQFWTQDPENLEAALNLLTIGITGIAIGRSVSDHREEIEKRAHLEWDLERAQATLSAAIEQSPVGVIIADAPDGRIRLANNAAVRIRGIVPSPLIDIPIERYSECWSIYRPDGTPWPSEEIPLAQAVRNGRFFSSVDLVICNAEGENRWLIANASPIRSIDGDVVGGIMVFTDVTERRKAEQELRRSEQRYRRLISATSEGFWLVDADGRTSDVNESLCRMLRISREELIGRRPTDFMDADNRAIYDEQVKLRDFLDNRSYDVVLIATNGDEIDVSINATTLRGPDGRSVGAFALCTDITERKRADRALRESEARFRTFMENSPTAIYLKDVAGRYVYVNEKFKEWYGLRETDVLGKTLHTVFSPADAAAYADQDSEVLLAGQPVSREAVVTHGDGSRHDVTIVKFPVLDSEGKFAGLGGINLDITDIRKANDALKHRMEFEGLVARISARLINVVGEKAESAVDRALGDVGEFTDSDVVSVFMCGDHDDDFHLVARWSADGGGKDTAFYASLPRAGNEAWLSVLGTGEAFQYHADQSDTESLGNISEFVQSREILTLIHLPIFRGAVLRGFLGLVASAEDHDWSDIDVMLLKLLAEIFGNLLERQEMEAAVRESESRFRELSELLPGIVFEIDGVRKLKFINRVGAEMLGYAGLEEMRDRDAFNLIAPGDRGRAAQRMVRILAGERPDANIYKYQRRDGSSFLGLTETARVLQDGTATGLRGFIIDVTERQRAEEALRQSEERFRLYFELGLVGMALAAPDGRWIQFNDRLCEILGFRREELETRRWSDVTHPGDMAVEQRELDRVMAGEIDGYSLDKRYVRKDGKIAHAAMSSRAVRDTSGQVEYFVTLIEDVTERRQTEETLQRAQKMEAVGQIAGGIAHDFNNLLGAIMGFATFIVEDADGTSSAYAFGQRIQKACERAKYMIQRLLAFSRRADSERQPLRIADILEESSELLRGTVPSTVRLETAIECPEAVVFADPVQLTQVFMNLCVNARDALEDAPGEIRIRVHALDKAADGKAAENLGTTGFEDDWEDAACVILGDVAADKGYVALDVVDTGKGMDQNLLDKVFEPFFTTKSTHRGTGLGLSVVHGIVLAHEGRLVVKSLSGRGTCFRILLPTTDSAPRIAMIKDEVRKAARVGRILVVDDDVDFADVVSITLERGGMEVGVCTDPATALEVFLDDPNAWDVVMSDFAMPEMTGIELIAKIKERRSDIACILCTAYAGDRLTPESVGSLGVSVLLGKPLEPSDILEAVRTCLERPDSGEPVESA